MDLPTFKKLPLGGVDRRALVGALARDGARVATELLAAQRAHVRPMGASIAPDAAVLILGGSNGITRALAVQLLFGEKARVYGVHFDSEKMQIGGFHVQAITAAAEHIGGKYLHDCTLYVTLEPCVMCAGAMNWAHIGRIVFGAFDEKGGYRRIGSSLLLHPKTKVTGGILEAECADLMKAFFRKKRAL